ncbi:hypothetical protein Y032_0223g2680 [Ancylostoma ceylanicum]|nr:hypothetical protein Y032_0223g2680 [Ancylostoma ceylanicum]
MLFLLARAQDQLRMEQWPLGMVRFHKRTLDNYDDYIDPVQEQISAHSIRSSVGMTRFGKRVSEPIRFQRNVGSAQGGKADSHPGVLRFGK